MPVSLPAIHELTTPQLELLLDALRYDRLSLPPSAAQLDLLLGGRGGSLAADISTLLLAGATLDLLVCLLTALLRERQSRPTLDEMLELVVTAPEKDGAGFRDTGVVVRELFRTAKNRVMLAGFAIYQGKQVFRELSENMDINTELKVELLLHIGRKPGDTSLASDIVARFHAKFFKEHWPGKRRPILYYDPRPLAEVETTKSAMHSKFIIVDDLHLFVTSANFTEAAQQRNYETGTLVTSVAHAIRLRRFIEGLVTQKILVALPST